MSINAKLNRLSLDLHNASQQFSTPKSTPSKSKPKPNPVAESWEDESLSDSDNNQQSPISGVSTPVEAPGPNIKSPTTRAIDAERELSNSVPDDMLIPPPTPISPQTSNTQADWSPASALGGGRPIYTSIPTAISKSTSTSNYLPSNPSSTSAHSTPTGTGSTTPTHRYPTPNPSLDSTSTDNRHRDSSERKRPEKTTATANRLIAGALGIRAPPKTDEQKQYERAVKEQEIRRKNREKEEKKKADEEDERARALVWES